MNTPFFHKLSGRLLAALTLLVLSLQASAQSGYVPSAANLSARERFAHHRLGIFLHWGIYSLYGQEEWYLNSGKLLQTEYAKAAAAFYPSRFDAEAWVVAIKASGAGYLTFTTRHHDSFSMFKTAESPYNIVDATPFGRDVLRELADACHHQGVDLHLYYSILDWARPDYPLGRTGHHTGRTLRPDYNSYMQFMKNQLRELLTAYGDVKAVWLDGYWDHDSDSIPFDWRMPELYSYVHSLRPACLIGNNHHLYPLPGEDFQMFERDQPGENHAGLSGQDVSALPLEMCQTMNGMWGYKVSDTNYKTVPELVQMLVRAASKSCNLLLNIGPQPDGELPALALDRLRGLGTWMRQYGSTVDGTVGGPVPEQSWGVSTMRGDTVYLHVLQSGLTAITVPLDRKPRRVTAFDGRKKLKWTFDRHRSEACIQLDGKSEGPDDIIIIER
jgi:Alpha-L-fucosidase